MHMLIYSVLFRKDHFGSRKE